VRRPRPQPQLQPHAAGPSECAVHGRSATVHGSRAAPVFGHGHQCIINRQVVDENMAAGKQAGRQAVSQPQAGTNAHIVQYTPRAANDRPQAKFYAWDTMKHEHHRQARRERAVRIKVLVCITPSCGGDRCGICIVHVCVVGTNTCVLTCLCVSVVVCILCVCSVICVSGGMRRARLRACGGVHECGRCVVRVVEGDRM